MKRWIQWAIAIVVLFVAVVLVVPFFVHADAFRPKIESELTSALGRKVVIGHIGFSLLSGSLVAKEITIDDDTAFSKAPFVKAKELRIGVQVGALLFHQTLAITDLTVDSPSIQVIRAKDGKWNFATLGGSSAPGTPAAQAGALSALTVGELRVQDGTIAASALAEGGRPFVFKDVNLTVKNFALAEAFPVELSLKFPHGEKVAVAGTVRLDTKAPVVDLHATTPNLSVDELEDLLPVAGVTLPSGSQLKGGTINAKLAVTGPLDAMTIAGPIELDNSVLEGFDLGGKIQGMNPISGGNGGTEIKKLYAVVENSVRGTRFSNIDAEVPRIGSATGEGTVSPANDLNFHMNAKIAALSAIGSVVGKLFGKGQSTQASSPSEGGVPVTVTGTAANPQIHAEVGKAMESAAKGITGNSAVQKPVKSLKGLFGR